MTAAYYDGQRDAKIDRLEESVEHLSKQMEQMSASLARIEGGWKVAVALAGGIGIVLGVALRWLLAGRNP